MKKILLLFSVFANLIALAQLKDIRILVPREIGYTYYDLYHFLPNEKFFVIAANALAVYNTETGEIIDEIELGYGAKSLSVNRAGNLFAVALNNEILFYNFLEQKLSFKEKISTTDLLKTFPGMEYYKAIPIGGAFFTGKNNEVYLNVGYFSFCYDPDQKQMVSSHSFQPSDYIIQAALNEPRKEVILAQTSGTNCAIVKQDLYSPANTSTIMVCNGIISKMNIRDSLLFCFAADKYFVMDLAKEKIIHEVRMPLYDYKLYGYDKDQIKALNHRVSLTKPDTVNFTKDEFVYDIDFLRDKKLLVYATSKGLKFIDPKTQKITNQLKNVGTNLKISSTGKRMIYNSYSPYKALRVYNPANLSLISERPSLGNQVSNTDISPDKKWLYTNGSTNGYLWNLTNLAKYAEIKDPSNNDSSYVANVFFLNDSEMVVNSGVSYKNLNLSIYDINRKQFKKIIKKNVFSISSGYHNGEFYYCDYNSLHIINLKSLAEEVYQGMFSLSASSQYNIVSFTNELVFIPNAQQFKIINRKTKKTIYENESWTVNSRVILNPDSKSALAFLPIKKKKTINGYEIEMPVNSLVRIDIQKKEIVKDYAESYFPYDYKLKENGKTLAVWYHKLDLTGSADKEIVYSEYDYENGSEKFTRTLAITKNIVASHFTSDKGKYFSLAEPSGKFFKVFDGTGAEIIDLSDMNIQIPKSFIDEQSDLMIITSMINSQVTFVDLRERRIMGQLINAAGDNFFMVTPDLNYIGSKEFVKALRFKYGSEIFGFDQFDAYLNTPHKVLKAFGCKDTALISVYESAYLKRLKVLGISPKSKIDFSSLPKVQTVSMIEGKTGFVHFAVSVNKGKANLKSFDIINNGNLVKRINIPESQRARYDGDFEFETSSGINRFEFVVKDENGFNSPRISRFYNNTSLAKPDLYLVVIASEKFENSDFNLSYALKDAGDVAATMSNSKSFEKTHIKKLFNQSFTPDSVKQLKKFFDKAGINDVVMIFFAGHGYLDEDFSYYFPTYFTNFDDPKINSVAYNSFEKLFSEMKPARKLMFIDACFSGEADEDANPNENESEKERKRNSSRSVKLTESSFAKSTALELSKAVFSDLRQNSGATIISSAGGTEAAFEGEKWNNGLFTYCLIKGLKSLKADQNYDEKIMLSELQKYVAEEVYKLSEGKQTPTYRVENIALDYELWGK
jgi:hypothetical protein